MKKFYLFFALCGLPNTILFATHDNHAVNKIFENALNTVDTDMISKYKKDITDIESKNNKLINEMEFLEKTLDALVDLEKRLVSTNTGYHLRYRMGMYRINVSEPIKTDNIPNFQMLPKEIQSIIHDYNKAGEDIIFYNKKWENANNLIKELGRQNQEERVETMKNLCGELNILENSIVQNKKNKDTLKNISENLQNSLSNHKEKIEMSKNIAIADYNTNKTILDNAKDQIKQIRKHLNNTRYKDLSHFEGTTQKDNNSLAQEATHPSDPKQASEIPSNKDGEQTQPTDGEKNSTINRVNSLNKSQTPQTAPPAVSTEEKSASAIATPNGGK